MIVVIGLPAYAGSANGEGSAGGLAVEAAAAAHALGSAVELVGKVGDDGAGDAVVLALGRMGIGHAALLRDPARPTPVLSATAAPVPTGSADEASADEASADEASGDGSAAEASADEASGDGSAAAALAGEGGEEEPRVEFELLPADPAARPGLDAGDIALAMRYLAETRVVVVAVPLPDVAVAAVVDGAAFAGARLVVLLPPGATTPALPPEATLLEAPAVDDGSFGRVVGAFAAGLDAGAEPAAAFSEAIRASGWQAVAD